MADGKMVTEREAVKRERAAFALGWMRSRPIHEAREEEKVAAELYPLPKVERPREVKIGNDTMRVVGGVSCFKTKSGGVWEWQRGYIAVRSADEARLALDLFENPTELVDSEEGQ